MRYYQNGDLELLYNYLFVTKTTPTTIQNDSDFINQKVDFFHIVLIMGRKRGVELFRGQREGGVEKFSETQAEISHPPVINNHSLNYLNIFTDFPKKSMIASLMRVTLLLFLLPGELARKLTTTQDPRIRQHGKSKVISLR